jgi:hypothetical protein
MRSFTLLLALALFCGCATSPAAGPERGAVNSRTCGGCAAEILDEDLRTCPECQSDL